MLTLYYYNKVEIASVFHIHVCRMLKIYRSIHHHPRRGRACPARALSHNHPLLLCHPVSPHTVGRGLDPSACPFPAYTRSPFRHPVGAGHARPATSPPPAVNLPPPAHSPKPPDPATLFPPPPIICARQPPSPQYTPCPNFSLKLCRKNQKTCKNLLTKVILLAIIIKLSRGPSPRRQPLEPLPTACTPFFEENFFKKLSENLLTNERI